MKFRRTFVEYFNNKTLSLAIYAGYEGSEIAGKLRKAIPIFSMFSVRRRIGLKQKKNNNK